MKQGIKGIKGCLLLAAMTQSVFADFSALSVYRTGAEAKVTFKIIDDEQRPVSNAVAHVWFCSDDFHQNDADWEEVTGGDGLFTVFHKTNYKLVCRINKDGYYESKETIVFPKREDGKLNVIDGKWQPYGETRTVVLKKIRDPWGVKVFNEQCHRRAIPAFGRWIGFDLENGDWTPPHGAGRFDDVLLRFTAMEKRMNDYKYEMEVSFTNNPHAGAYLMKKDCTSQLTTVYAADSNATFLTSFDFLKEQSPGTRRHWDFLDSGTYLVFRTRTRIDEHGNLVGAHYGKILGQWLSELEFMILGDGCFNLVENDTNIEGDQALLYKIKNYKKER